MAEEEKKKQDKWELKQVATQTEDVIFDNDNQKTYSIAQALVIMLNQQEQILKALKG